MCAALAVPALAATRTVKVGPGTSFVPKTLTIKRGDSVRFRWTGSLPHNVTVTRGPVKFKTRTTTRGTVTRRFTRRGRYTIVCTVHLPGMRLNLRVR